MKMSGASGANGWTLKKQIETGKANKAGQNPPSLLPVSRGAAARRDGRDRR